MPGRRRSGACVRCCLVAFAVVSALYVSGPAIYRTLKRCAGEKDAPFSASCAPCVCNCPPQLSLESIAPGLSNLSIPDCGKGDPELSKEMEKKYVDLLAEELQLQRAVADEITHHTRLTLLETQKLASQYRKETNRCNIATLTCEEAREQAETSFRQEKKVTAEWERRARQLGWE